MCPDAHLTGSLASVSLTPLRLRVNYAIGSDLHPTNCLAPIYAIWDVQMLVPIKPFSPLANIYFFLKFFLKLSCPMSYDSLSGKYD